MKILVPIKRVPDPDTRIRIRPDGSGIETEGVKFSINPFDAIALEEALRLREQHGVDDILVVSIGGPDCAEVLRAGLGMGADRALHIREDGALDSLAVARLLAAVFRREQPQLVLMGKQAIDDDANQVGQMLAGLLGIGQATFISRLTLPREAAHATCCRETDGGLETVSVALPAVLSADLRLNEPRYVTALGIMKAKKKPLEESSAAALGVNAAPRARQIKLESVPPRKPGVRVRSVEEMVDRLRHEARVI